MASTSLANWDHTLFHQLQQLLSSVVAQPRTSTLRRLYALLEESQPWLLRLTQIPGSSDTDKQYVENNPTTTPSNTVAQISGDLINTVQNVSSGLSISQILASTLGLQAEENMARYPSRTLLEISTYIFHEWTSQMLDFLRELLRVTIGSDAESDAPFDTLKEWVEILLTTKTSLGPGKGEGTIIDQIMGQLDVIQLRIGELMRQGAGADFELASFRVAALRAEQVKMVGILGAIAEGGLLGRGHVIKLLKWMKKAERMDGLVSVVFSAFLAACKPLDAVDANDPRFDNSENWCKDIKFLRLASNLVLQEQWGVPPLREASKLAWCLFYISALRHDSSVAQVGIDPSQAEQFIADAIAGNALRFLDDMVLAIRRERGLEPSQPEAMDALAKLATRSDPINDAFIYGQICELGNILASKKHFLRNLRNKEEDVAVRRSQATPPPAHFQEFLSLTAAVYKSLPPDTAEEIWDNTTFTGVVLDSRGGWPSAPFWEMLSAISTGPSCAAKSFEKMKDTRLQWTALFKFYQHYSDIMPHLFEPIKSTRTPNMEPMAFEDAEICKGWTRLLTTVVKWSDVARNTLLQSKPHPLQQLFDFINCDIPIDLKAVVLDAVTAFCSRADDETKSRAVEFYERISFTELTLEVRLDGRIPMPIGWIAKMEYSEQDVQNYSLTRAYIGFLTSLLSTANTRRINNALRRGVFYIFDRVLLPERRYTDETKQWEMMDSIFTFIEKALQVFDLSDLLNPSNRTIATLATSLSDEPGFLVLLRLLSEPPAFEKLAAVIYHSNTTSYLGRQVLQKVLRIYYRIMEVQLVFSDILLLALADTGSFRRPLGLQSIDHYLLNHLGNITNIALLVGDDDLSTAFVALKIIVALSQSPIFSRSDVFRGEYATSINRLAGILDASDDSIRIAQGFCSRLDEESDDLPTDEINSAESTVLRGGSVDTLPYLIRNTILDLLLEGTSEAGPNLAHFLLGFDFKAPDFGLQDPGLPTSRLSCLHIILQQLNGDLFSPHPTMAAKCANLIQQLYSNPVTGQATMSYATSIAEFSVTQLINLPRSCPGDGNGNGIVFVSGRTESEVITTGEKVVAFLDFQRWILSLTALDTFAFQGHGAGVAEMSSVYFEGVEGASGPLITELLDNLDLQWQERQSGHNDKSLEFFAGFDFDQFKRIDADWWDLKTLKRAMIGYKKQLLRSGAITSNSIGGINSEIDYALDKLSSRNRETDIALAKGHFLGAWLEALKVSLAMLFTHVPEDRQEIILFDLLAAIFARIDSDMAIGILEILCESVLVTTTALVSNSMEYDGVNLPLDRLAALLRSIIDAVSRPGSTEKARGNLYASISQILQLVVPSTFIDDASVVTAMGRESDIQRMILNVLATKKDRLIPSLCRDAMDDRDIWKTECFSLLGSIVSTTQSEKDKQILEPLLQQGFLNQFIKSIKDRELALQECLIPESEDLRAFWVYEAKVSFLLSLAASRRGAEELLEKGLFEVFATCGFMTVPPITGDLLGDPELRDALMRQHRVLICGLQLLARTLSSLVRSKRSGAGHAISFLNAHRETILLLLQEHQNTITSTGVEECRLIISILAMTVHKIPSEDLRSPTGFGAFHLATLSVATRFLDSDAWTDNVIDSEENLDAAVLELNQVILTYLITTTKGLKAGSGYPVLVAGTNRGNGPAKFISSAPSLQLVVNYLAKLAEITQEVSNDYESALEADATGKELDEKMLQDLGISKEDASAFFASQASLLFSMVDLLLLLIWRHLLFYANDVRNGEETVRPDNLSLSLGSYSVSQQLNGSKSVIGTVKSLERIAGNLRGTLERLEDMEVHPDLTRKRSTSGKEDAYYGMLLRRLVELSAVLTGIEMPDRRA